MRTSLPVFTIAGLFLVQVGFAQPQHRLDDMKPLPEATGPMRLEVFENPETKRLEILTPETLTVAERCELKMKGYYSQLAKLLDQLGEASEPEGMSDAMYRDSLKALQFDSFSAHIAAPDLNSDIGGVYAVVSDSETLTFAKKKKFAENAPKRFKRTYRATELEKVGQPGVVVLKTWSFSPAGDEVFSGTEKGEKISLRPLQALCEGKKDFRLEVNGKSYSYLLDVELANLSGQINEALSIARSRAASFDPNHSWIKDLLAARDLTDALSVDPSIAETVSQQLRNRSHVTMPDVDPATTFRLE